MLHSSPQIFIYVVHLATIRQPFCSSFWLSSTRCHCIITLFKVIICLVLSLQTSVYFFIPHLKLFCTLSVNHMAAYTKIQPNCNWLLDKHTVQCNITEGHTQVHCWLEWSDIDTPAASSTSRVPFSYEYMHTKKMLCPVELLFLNKCLAVLAGPCWFPGSLQTPLCVCAFQTWAQNRGKEKFKEFSTNCSHSVTEA